MGRPVGSCAAAVAALGPRRFRVSLVGARADRQVPARPAWRSWELSVAHPLVGSSHTFPVAVLAVRARVVRSPPRRRGGPPRRTITGQNLFSLPPRHHRALTVQTPLRAALSQIRTSQRSQALAERNEYLGIGVGHSQPGRTLSPEGAGTTNGPTIARKRRRLNTGSLSSRQHLRKGVSHRRRTRRLAMPIHSRPSPGQSANTGTQTRPPATTPARSSVPCPE